MSCFVKGLIFLELVARSNLRIRYTSEKLGRWRGQTSIVSRSIIASLCGGKVAIVLLAEIRWAHSPFFIKLFRQVRAALIA